ncbi:MAG TPA: hypothetical protein VNQ76_04355 [Planctomicrobium sp.]|nr:hypothetical protein [Planctomicrobium sp.]
MLSTITSGPRGIGAFCRDMVIFYSQLEGFWLFPEIEDKEESGNPEFELSERVVVQIQIPSTLLARLSNLRTALKEILDQSQNCADGCGSGFHEKGLRLNERLEEVERFLTQTWNSESHQQLALNVDRLADTPEGISDRWETILQSSHLTKAPWTTLVQDFDEFRWELKSPFQEIVQHVLTISLIIYSSRVFLPRLFPVAHPQIETERIPDLQLPPLRLDWGLQGSLQTVLGPLVEESVSESATQAASSYLGIRFDSDTGRVDRSEVEEYITLKPGLQRSLFGRLLRNEGALLTREAMRSNWPGNNWTSNGSQKAMSDLRDSLEPLHLGIKNERSKGYRLIESPQ